MASFSVAVVAGVVRLLCRSVTWGLEEVEAGGDEGDVGNESSCHTSQNPPQLEREKRQFDEMSISVGGVAVGHFEEDGFVTGGEFILQHFGAIFYFFGLLLGKAFF